MREQVQIPRQALTWALIAQAVVLAPHSLHMPVWLWGVWLLAALWRWQVYRGAWAFAGFWVRAVLVVICAGGLMLGAGWSFGTETMVSLLLVGFVLKLLEVKNRRDFVVLCFLGYLASASQFLFKTDLLASAYGLISIALVTTSLVALHQSLSGYRPRRSLMLGGSLMLQALPVMVVLFLLLPRVGSLWSVPTNESVARTGLSDEMAPGDITQLSQSRELAFRVTFEGEPPPTRDLYWRALVFSEFDGRRWTQSSRQQLHSLVDWEGDADWRAQLEGLGREVSYEIMLEPNRRHWLYVLSAPTQWSDDIGIGREFRLQRRQPVTQRLRYRVTSALDYRYDPEPLPQWLRQQELQLPAQGNPRTRALAQQWREEGDDGWQLVERFNRWIADEFRYTLEPPPLGDDSVDEFLWQSQAGFCEHFASAFVFFMRAAGVPARVVLGYQGGELNPLENYLRVRQQEAHAWAEIWLPERGWVRVDPTAAVAPERIEMGLLSSLDATESARITGPLDGVAWAVNLRLRWDLINYQWHRRVLGYDAEARESFLLRWLRGTDPWRVAVSLTVTLILVTGLIVLRAWWQRRPRYAQPADRYWLQLQRRLSKAGYPPRPGEGPRTYSHRLAGVWAERAPDAARQLIQIAELYERVNYGGNRRALTDLIRLSRAFRVTEMRSAPL
ncbi:transglutaminase TgpA family protein [Marinimicrobium alkaliphilum]|uniref:transglutaminase TgpA family protein n=1 Tax=Marinimicrobium alkaliphilum TaxID=2202654 RepID=UPI0018E08F59|nr:DUF3488 and transglutaminase-like domain-containing protein [Marinimicrobium alkaliphilum]